MAINMVMDFVVTKIQTLMGTLKFLPDCAIRALTGALNGELNGLALRPILSRVRIYEGQGWVGRLRAGGDPVDAITIGRNIYIAPQEYDLFRSNRGLALIGHEVMHVTQYIRAFHPLVFIGKYLSQAIGAGYGGMKLENDAFDIGHRSDGKGKLDQMPELAKPCLGG